MGNTTVNRPHGHGYRVEDRQSAGTKLAASLQSPFNKTGGTGMARNTAIEMRSAAMPILAAGLAALALAAPASAQEMVYRPTNPSFGGDPFNSSHLLSIANAQNDYKAPSAESSSATDQFVRQLQSRLLSSLASEVTDAIFGENPQESGTVVFGDQVISFERGLESVQLVIVDNATGSRTEIEIPLLSDGDAASAAGLDLSSSALGATGAAEGGDLTSSLGGF